MINKEKLKESLPYCVRIVSSNEDERDDIITLEFDRENCIPLNEVIKYAVCLSCILYLRILFCLDWLMDRYLILYTKYYL